MAFVLRDRWSVFSANEVKDGEAEKNESCADKRTFEIAGVAPDEDGAGADDECGGDHGVPPDTVGSVQLRPPFAIEENGGGGEHVEEPLGEDGEFEVLLELGEEKEQDCGEQSLDDKRRRGRLESRVDVCELPEEEAVASGGEGDARAGHDGAVERDEDAECHGGGNESRAARAGDDGEGRDGGSLCRRDLRGGQDVLDGGVRRHEEDADDEEAADESDGQRALGTANFAGDHREVIPSVISPEGGDKSEHESAETAGCVGKRRGEVRQRSGCRCEAERGDDENEHGLKNREDELEVAGFFDPEVIESGDQPCDGDGEDLRPQEWCAGNVIGEEVKCRKDPESACESAGDGCDGCGLCDGKPCPHVEKGGRVAIGSAEIDVLAAGVGEHSSEFGVSHGAEEREQAARDPGEIDHSGRAGVAHHFRWDEKDTAADDGADDDGGGLRGAEDAGKVSRRGAGGRGNGLVHAVM